MAASAMKWSQHALNQRGPRSVGTSNTAEMLHWCVRSGPVRRLPVGEAARRPTPPRAVMPARAEPVRSSRRGLAGVLVERRPDRRPPRLGQVVDPTPDGVAGRSVAQSEDVQAVGDHPGVRSGDVTRGARCTPCPASTEAYAVGSGAASSSRSCTKLGSNPSPATRTASSRTRATWCVRSGGHPRMMTARAADRHPISTSSGRTRDRGWPRASGSVPWHRGRRSRRVRASC